MAELTLSFLSPWQVEHKSKGPVSLRGFKAQALLAYLAVNASQQHSRETMVGLLWPELSESDARNNLRVGLSRLRRAIESKDKAATPFILSDRYLIQFNPESDFQLDVADFEGLLNDVEQHDHPDLYHCISCRGCLAQAVDLYHGEFLTGFSLDECLVFDEWLHMQREYYHVLVMKALDELTESLHRTQEHNAAELYARRQLALDPLHEDAHFQLIQSLFHQGQRTTALSQFDTCERVLDEELGIEPNDDLRDLVAQIRASTASGGTKKPSLDTPPVVETPATPVPETEKPPARPDPFEILSRLEMLPDQRLFGVQEVRERLNQVLQVQERPWFVTISGLGGMGKTTLAHDLVQELVHTERFYNIAWVSAKQEEFLPEAGIQSTHRPALDVDTLSANLLQQLGEPHAATASPQEKRVALLRLLKTQPHLIIIDNLETVVDYQSLIPFLRPLSNPTKFLLTSRHSLQDYADVYSLNLTDLRRNNAVDLMKHEAQVRAIASLSSASDEQLSQLYQAIGGNPLALKLVIGQTRFLPISQLLRSLQEAQNQKVGDLYTYIYQTTWDMLDADSQQVLVTLPLSQNGTFADLVTVSGLSPDAVQHALGQLTAYSTVETSGDLEEPRYRLHRLTEAFLLKEIVQWHQVSGDTLSEWGQLFQDQLLQTLQHWLDSDTLKNIDVPVLDQYRVSLLQLIVFGLDSASAWPYIRDFCIAFAPYMERRGHWEIWHRRLQQAIQAAQREQDLNGEVTLTAFLARVCQRQSKFAETEKHYCRVIKLARQIDNGFEEARACSNLGYLYIDGGHWWRSEVLCCHALDIFERLESDHGRAHTHNHLGLLYARQQDWTQGDFHLNQALTIGKTMNDNHILLQILINLGSLYVDQKSFKKSISYLERALNYANRTGNEAETGAILVNLGLAYLLADDYNQATDYFDQANELFIKFSDLLGQTMVIHNLGNLQLRQKNWSEGIKLCEKAIDEFRTLGNWNGEFKVLCDLIDFGIQNRNEVIARNYLHQLDQIAIHRFFGKFPFANNMVIQYRYQLEN
ncbi:MAG: tetratricopeptide repeat protein [Chloroflexota bacterium]